MTLAISSGLIAAIVALIAVDIFAIAFGLSFRRAQKANQPAGAAPLPAAPSKSAPSLSRRDFFRGSLLVSLMVFGAEFGGATLAFLWPNLRGGFGSLINAGPVADIRNEIQSSNGPVYFGAGKFYVWDYGASYKGIDEATGVDYAAGGYIAEGLMALYQKCAHLGCRVPFCNTSKWFECPCHGSKYNLAGEWQLGPAPNGLYRFPVSVSNGNLLVDTSAASPAGPPRGTDTIHENPQGPFCVAPG